MADQGQVAPTSALTPEMLAAIAAVTAATLRQHQQQPPAPPPAPVVPPFTGAGATTQFGGKPLPALFPSIESKIILDIVLHAFMPLDLPRLLSPLAARQEYVAPPSSAPAAEHTLALKHFPSFHSLLRPLNKYFEVLSAFAASSGKPWEVFAITRSLSDYISHLAELHQQYKWSAVIIYHVEFHTARLWEMKDGNYSGWSRPDIALLSRLVFIHPLPLPSSSPSTAKPPKSVKTSPTPIEQQICFDWNSGICASSPCPKSRRHVCRTCESPDHPNTDCTEKI
ncbi:Integrase/recombinase xerD-like protein [Mycena sanguinolenta]|uniref:Integrase/recombinase xerD-like protein n=1 Tax=Mycena sanguinolenta TaxID=230812 RepID=A0A8H6ZK63_9AGAR|nr:Integrase/recombinase xerD-like protein [Mycena sanguinolenta]